MIDSFKILEPKYSNTKRNLFGLINLIISLALGVIIMMNCLPYILRFTDNQIVSLISIFLLASVFPIIMILIEKKIINAYFVIGHIHFRDKIISINTATIIDIDYKSIKIIYLSPTLIIPKANIISFTAQILTYDQGAIDVHLHINSDSYNDNKIFFLFKTKKDIFDILKERRIRYEWIRKKKNI